MSDMVRTPVQKRSIDKKNRIIQAGYQLFAEKGYHSTNTAEIAKKAEVSTGIVYGYFRDKRDILIEVLDLYVEKVFQPIFDMFETISSATNFDDLIAHSIDSVVRTHRSNAQIHEALHSLTHTDEAIRNRFTELEDEMTQKLVAVLSKNIKCENLNEKVHLAIITVQSYAHECVYDTHEYLNYDNMRALVIGMLNNLFLSRQPF